MEYTEKSLDTFPTVYEKDYRWWKNSVIPVPYKNIDAYQLTAAQKEEYLTVIKERYSEKELRKDVDVGPPRSVYAVSYCHKYHPNLRPEVVEVTYEDALLDAAAKFYGPKTNKVLAPLPSFRRVMGFASVADSYCGHSEYQEGVSKTGYLVMKDSLGEGEKRMLRRKPSPPPLPPLPPLPPTDFTLLPEEERRQMWR